jgi:phosphoribosylamine--glycine ligase
MRALDRRQATDESDRQSFLKTEGLCMNVLVIGGGGREHVVSWKLRQSPRLTDLHAAPGNAGTAAFAHNVELPVPPNGADAGAVAAYLDAVVKTARGLKIDLVFVAPEDPLSWGLVDRLDAEGIAAFGPSKAAATLEASKGWTKAFMARHGIPHPRTATFDDPDAARDYVRGAGYQVVVKADGLAVGKGAIVTSTVDEALEAIDELMVQGIVGEAGRRVVIEERIGPREVSGHAFSDGKTFVAMPLSCDHKTVHRWHGRLQPALVGRREPRERDRVEDHRAGGAGHA